MEPAYANLARISHSPADIVIDFAHILPGETTANIRSRVVMTPLSAKLLLRALNENLARYEAAFGEIMVPSNSSLAENLFRRITRLNRRKNSLQFSRLLSFEKSE